MLVVFGNDGVAFLRHNELKLKYELNGLPIFHVCDNTSNMHERADLHLQIKISTVRLFDDLV